MIQSRRPFVFLVYAACLQRGFIGAAAAGAGAQKSLAHDSHVVLRLKYCWEARRVGEISLGSPGREFPGWFVPALLSADQRGHFYLSDQHYARGGVHGTIRVFDPVGREIRTIVDERLSECRAAVGTGNGYVWATRGGGEMISDRPAVRAWIYGPTGSKAMSDLAAKLPQRLAPFLEEDLGPQWYDFWHGGEGPLGVGKSCATNNGVVLYSPHRRLTRESPGGACIRDRMLRLEFSSDGRTFLGGKVVSWLREQRYTSASGQEWVTDMKVTQDRDGFTDFTKPWTYWVYLASNPAEKVLLTTSRRAQHLFGDRFKGVIPTLIGVDTKHRIYVVWRVGIILKSERDHVPSRQILRYTLADGSHVEMEAGYGFVLTVFNPTGQIVHNSELTVLPSGIEPENWVQPVPDGSGYYELRLLEREAQVVFHPLPAP